MHVTLDWPANNQAILGGPVKDYDKINKIREKRKKKGKRKERGKEEQETNYYLRTKD